MCLCLCLCWDGKGEEGDGVAHADAGCWDCWGVGGVGFGLGLEAGVLVREGVRDRIDGTVDGPV